MSRANREKRARRRAIIDPFGREGVLIHTPPEWLDMDTGLPPERADHFVSELRSLGIEMWLRPMPDGTVRTRFMMPNGPDLPDEMLEVLAKYARDIAKAIARSGKYDPPPGNPFGDLPLPPGGHWDWRES